MRSRASPFERGCAFVALVVLAACAHTDDRSPASAARVVSSDPSANEVSVEVAAPPSITPPPAPRETRLGVRDVGVFSDLDERVELDLPSGALESNVTATIDRGRALLVVFVDGFPAKPYPIVDAGEELHLGESTVRLRAGDRAELAPLLREAHELASNEPVPFGDRDGDGIPDPLDVLVGAHKAALNADHYVASYVRLPYPNGDVPRSIGVCTDVVVRAVRNAGLDLQVAVHDDIRAAPALFPFAKTPDASIDHRRVQNLLPYFARHWEAHTKELGDASDPLRPGDVVLLDTFPDRYGPDHLGVLSEHVGASGRLTVINNWTDGTVTQEMDLLAWVPVLYRFRLAEPRARSRGTR